MPAGIEVKSMKVLLKEDFDSSIPKWLKNEINRSDIIKIHLMRIADLSKMKYIPNVLIKDNSDPNTCNVYLIPDDNNDLKLYIVGANDEGYIEWNSRRRAFKNISAKSLKDKADQYGHLEFDKQDLLDTRDSRRENKIGSIDRRVNQKQVLVNPNFPRLTAAWMDFDASEVEVVWKTLSSEYDKSGYKIRNLQKELVGLDLKDPAAAITRLYKKATDLKNALGQIINKIDVQDFGTAIDTKDGKKPIHDCLMEAAKHLSDPIETLGNISKRLSDPNESARDNYIKSAFYGLKDDLKSVRDRISRCHTLIQDLNKFIADKEKNNTITEALEPETVDQSKPFMFLEKSVDGSGATCLFKFYAATIEEAYDKCRELINKLVDKQISQADLQFAYEVVPYTTYYDDGSDPIEISDVNIASVVENRFGEGEQE